MGKMLHNCEKSQNKCCLGKQHHLDVGVDPTIKIESYLHLKVLFDYVEMQTVSKNAQNECGPIEYCKLLFGTSGTFLLRSNNAKRN